MDDGEWLKTAFGSLLKAFREERGLSQTELALESELDQTFVSLLERDKRQPSLASVFALCDALDTTPDVMIRELVSARHRRTEKT